MNGLDPEEPTGLDLRLHGVHIAVRGAEPSVIDRVRQFFAPFVQSQSGGAQASLHIRVSSSPPPAPDPGTRFYQGTGPTGAYALYRGPQARQAVFEGVGGFSVQEQGGNARAWLTEQRSIADDAVLSFCVAELLKPFGVFTLHAAALAKSGLGVIISGPSGAGKSTSSLSLAAGGYEYLSDDYPFWTAGPQGPTLLGFDAPFKLTRNTAAFFPEINIFEDAAPDTDKLPFVPATVFDTRFATSAQPRLLLFPQIVDTAHSEAVPIGKTRALETLLPNALVCFDPRLTKTQFQALAKLVDGCQSYTLRFGRDVRALPRLVDGLLAKCLSPD